MLARLEDEGLLKSVQSVGNIVTDVDIETLAQTYRLRMELAELIGRLDPVDPATVDVPQFRDLHSSTKLLRDRPDPLKFAQINIEFFRALMSLSRNVPFREVSERL